VRNKTGFLPFFLAGLATGAALALLLAPNTGEATRRLIGRKAGEGRDLLKARAVAGRDYVKARGAELRERVKAAVASEGPVGTKPDESAPQPTDLTT
jgi:gas vesicle protein